MHDRARAAVRQVLDLDVVRAVEQPAAVVGHDGLDIDVAAAEIDDDAAAAALDHVAAILVAVPPAIIAGVVLLALLVAISRTIAVAPAGVGLVLLLRLLLLLRLHADRLLQLFKQLVAKRADLFRFLGVALRLELLLDGRFLRRWRSGLCGRLRGFLRRLLSLGLLLASAFLLLRAPARLLRRGLLRRCRLGGRLLGCGLLGLSLLRSGLFGLGRRLLRFLRPR